ncbi:hypothetical protein CK503_07190 [Aliifodinibius salipaludis]|uniref:Uncharacterized protein n=1 Tax=Fodinibius salipaludis TaxID=2032627 RepID=A0A2A2GAG0_9BACT|nr:hypothetical protein CK503_07190 [Aliifodinibius salipaludis]
MNMEGPKTVKSAVKNSPPGEGCGYRFGGLAEAMGWIINNFILTHPASAHKNHVLIHSRKVLREGLRESI